MANYYLRIKAMQEHGSLSPVLNETTFEAFERLLPSTALGTQFSFYKKILIYLTENSIAYPINTTTDEAFNLMEADMLLPPDAVAKVTTPAPAPTPRKKRKPKSED